jgi:hypothetical protein
MRSDTTAADFEVTSQNFPERSKKAIKTCQVLICILQGESIIEIE